MGEAGWTTLGELRPGTLFETDGGERGVTVFVTPGALRQWVRLGDGVHMYDGGGRAVRPLPAPGEPPGPLTDEDREAARRELAALLARYEGWLRVGREAAHDHAGRLLWYLGVPPQMRAFIDALAGRHEPGATLMAFRDWLHEQDRDADAALFAEGWKGRLIGMVREYGDRREDEGRGVITAPSARRALAAVERAIGLGEVA